MDPSNIPGVLIQKPPVCSVCSGEKAPKLASRGSLEARKVGSYSHRDVLCS